MNDQAGFSFPSRNQDVLTGDDGIPFDEKMSALTTKLAKQFARGSELEKSIRENLKGIGYEF
ncbi:MAG: hypothetical protein V1782_06045 [Pseudomonadota bacterium]